MSLMIIFAFIIVIAAAIALAAAGRVIVRERRRAEARVAYLATRMHDPGTTPAAGPEGPVHVDALFNQSAAPARPAWLAVTVAIAATVVVVLVLGALRPGGAPVAPASPTALATPQEMPLELVALDDERSSDRLTIRGVVRNPARGDEIDHVVAVVMVFNDQGGFLTSGRAALSAAALAPGGESAFVITIPDAAAVGRYRVSFRDDSRVIPHVDRRHT